MVPPLAFIVLMVANFFYDLDNIADLIGALANEIEPGHGPHYGVDLVNDTTEPLEFMLCTDDECEAFAAKQTVAPGNSYPIVAEPGEPAWWLAQDEKGNVRGCFRIDFDLSGNGIDLLTSQLQPCP